MRSSAGMSNRRRDVDFGEAQVFALSILASLQPTFTAHTSERSKQFAIYKKVVTILLHGSAAGIGKE